MFTIFATLLGACVGSFLNVCIYRMPLPGLSVARPRGSFCPRCRAEIRWFDNIPVLSWLALGGRCRSCEDPISARYPAIELLTAGLFLVVWLRFVPEDPADLLAARTWTTLLFWWTCFASMIVIAMIDVDHRIIPDDISVTGGAAVPLVAAFVAGVPVDRAGLETVARALEPLDAGLAPAAAPWIQGGLALLLAAGAAAGYRRWFPYPEYDPETEEERPRRRSWWETRWAGAVGLALGIALGGLIATPHWFATPTSAALVPSLLGAAVGAGTIYGVGVLGTVVFRKDAMGFGDVKLMGFLGGLLGAKYVLLAIFIASLLGSVIGTLQILARRARARRDDEPGEGTYIPFGPFLCAGAAILVLGHEQVQSAVDWYLELFR